jgi:restriction system protein
MAEITRERQGKMVRAVLEVLKDKPEGLPARQVIEEVASRLGMTDFESSDYPNRPGVRRFDKILRFNTIPAVKAGWLIKSRGQWTLTDEGRVALEKFPGDPAEFMRESVRLYQAWRRSQPDIEPEEVVEEDAETETALGTLEEAEEAAWTEITGYIRDMNPYDFQDLVGALLRAMGYHVTWTAPPGPDRGLDLLAYTDPIGATGPRIKVQVKHRPDAKTAVDGIRSFMAILGTQDVGLYVSSGGFTPDSEREVRSQDTRRVTLINLELLVELWIQHYERASEVDRQLLPLKPVHFLAPPE